MWKAIFSSGRVEPQNHSMTHKALGTNAEGEYKTEEKVKSEIIDSGNLLKEMFPEYDFLCLAPTGGAGDPSLTEAARKLAMTKYYMLRGAVAFATAPFI